MSLKVNGQTYGWGDVDVKIPGLVLVAVSYTHLTLPTIA